MRHNPPAPRRPTLHRTIPIFAGIVALLAIGRPAAAQEDEASEPDRWSAAAEFTLTDSRGNQEVTVLTSGFTLEHLRVEAFEFKLELRARYGRSNGDRIAENYRGQINFDIRPGGSWAPFLRTTAEKDPYKRLDVRVNSGAGAKYRFRGSDAGGDITLSLGMLYSYERLAPPDDAPPTASAPVSNSALWDLQFTGNQRIRDGVTFTSEAVYRPVHDTPGDYLLEIDTGVRVLVTQRIALSVGYEFARDSTPPEGVEKDDRLTRAGIIIEL